MAGLVGRFRASFNIFNVVLRVAHVPFVDSKKDLKDIS